MQNVLDDLTSSNGTAAINALACAIFLSLIGLAMVRQKVSLGTLVGGIGRSEKPRAFWAVIFLYAVIALWTGVIAASTYF
jgi:hypothetical protein